MNEGERGKEKRTKSYSIFFYFVIGFKFDLGRVFLNFIYLAVLGLSCGTQHL